MELLHRLRLDGFRAGEQAERVPGGPAGNAHGNAQGARLPRVGGKERWETTTKTMMMMMMMKPTPAFTPA